jgi:hypothetical protein
MDKLCSNDKAKSKQNFVPGKDAPIDDNDMPPPRNTKHRPASKPGSTVNHQHQHTGSINVYHHQGKQSQGNKQQQGKQSQGNKQQQGKQENRLNTYQDPAAGATVLGYL